MNQSLFKERDGMGLMNIVRPPAKSPMDGAIARDLGNTNAAR